MKGKKTFTKSEANKIIHLLGLKVNSERNKQKTIRDKIRRIGFYITDFDQTYSGFTKRDFNVLIKKNIIKII